MAYQELEHVIEVGSEPMFGPVDWRMAATGGGLGLLLGMPVAALFGVHLLIGFLGGVALGAWLTWRRRDVLIVFRLLLVLRLLVVRYRTIDLGAAPKDAQPVPQVHTLPRGVKGARKQV